MLGRPFMTWQHHVANVALEVNERGFLQYRVVVLVVPRQQGKSSLLQAVMVRTCLGGYDQTVIYSAQDRTEARRRLLTELDERTLARSTALRRSYKTRRTNGDERVQFGTGSYIGIVAPTVTAGHGQTLDLGVIDEAFAHHDLSLPQAFGPAMVTRRNAQLWIVSVVGDGTDTLLQHYQAEGEASLLDVDARIAFFEWSAPDGDLYDPAVWASCMPALGITVDVDDVRADPTYGDPEEFARAYLCRRPTREGLTALNLEKWGAGVRDVVALADPVVFAFDVSVDRAWATIAAASTVDDAGTVGVEMLERRTGTAWVVDRLVELCERHSPAAVLLDAHGPAGALLAALARFRLPIVEVNPLDVARACGELVDHVVDDRVVHLSQAPLDDAVVSAGRVYTGDAFRWRRRPPAIPGTAPAFVDLSPLYAVTLAHHGVLIAPGYPVVAAR